MSVHATRVLHWVLEITCGFHQSYPGQVPRDAGGGGKPAGVQGVLSVDVQVWAGYRRRPEDVTCRHGHQSVEARLLPAPTVHTQAVAALP